MSGEGYFTLVTPISGGGQRFMMGNDAGKVFDLNCFVELSGDKEAELQAVLIRFFEQAQTSPPSVTATTK
jgi:hypothetical protein